MELHVEAGHLPERGTLVVLVIAAVAGWFSLEDISPEERADALEHFHDDDAWTHQNVNGTGPRMKFSLSLEDGWIEVIRLPGV